MLPISPCHQTAKAAQGGLYTLANKLVEIDRNGTITSQTLPDTLTH